MSGIDKTPTKNKIKMKSCSIGKRGEGEASSFYVNPAYLLYNRNYIGT
jgi:hypothetical protein